MADIKTRDAVKGTIKTIDKAAVASERMKSAYSKIKSKAEQGYYADENSATEYAADKVSAASERITDEGVHQFNKQGQKGVKTTKDNVVKAKDKISEFKQKRAAKAAEQRMSGNSVQTYRSTVSRSADKAVKGAQQTEKTIKQTARNGKKTVKTAAKGTVKTTQKSVKTAQATSKAAIKTAEHTAKATQAAAKASVKAAQRAAQAARATAKATIVAVKAAVKATIAAVKAIIAGTKALISAIAAGGWVAVVVILVIVIIGGIIAAVCGVFTPNDAGSYSVVYMMSACDSEYDARELEIVNNTPHDYLVIEGQEASKKDVIAVFAVLTNSTNKDFSDLNSELLDEFRAVFNTMNTVEHYTSTSEETVIREYSDAEGNPYQVEETVVKTTLHIEYTSMTASEGADVYHFNEKQREQLNTLLSSDFDELWAGILGQ